MTTLDDIRSAADREATAAANRALPADYRPHVELRDDGGVAATGLVDDTLITCEDDLLAMAGLDPQAWELEPGTKRIWAHNDSDRRSIYFGFRKRDQHSELATWLASKIEPAKPTDRPAQTSSGSGDPLFIALADLQIGKTDRLGGTPELIRRCDDVLARLVEQCSQDRPREIVLADLGDICENTSSHTSSSQAATNDLPVSEQLRVAARILMTYIITLRPLTDRMTVAAVRSNHGEERLADGKTNGGDWGIMAAGIVQDAFRLIGDDDVTFRLQEPLEAGVRVELGDLAIGLTHGHYARRVDRMGDWVAQQCGGLRPSVFDDCRVIVHGHYHHLTAASSRGRLILGCPAMESGSDWVAKRSGEYGDPGVLTFRERDGHLADLRVITPA